MNLSNNKNILIIEDDISLSDNLSMFLSKKNFHVFVSHTGKEALDICFRNTPDLILCDVQLPDMGGFSIIQKLKASEITKSVPFIFMSGSADSIDVKKALNLGATEYLTKPVKVNSLLEIINNSILVPEDEKQAILIIEDDPDIRDNLYSLFVRNGYKVLAASNGEDGLEKAFNSYPDLIICDIMLPDLDGYSVLEKLAGNKKTQTIPFIYLTAKSDLSDIRKGMSLGADDYITKPFKSEDLLNSVKKRINKLANIKSLYKSYGGPFEGQNIINKDNNAAEQNLKGISNGTKSGIGNIPAGGPWNSGTKDNELKIGRPVTPQKTIEKIVPQPPKKLPVSVYDDKDFENFLANRIETIDYQSYNYKNVLVILTNLNIANQKEATLFNKYLQNIIKNENLKIVIDMSRIVIFDSTFVGVLINCKKLISEKGGQIKLVMIISKQFSNTMIQQSIEKNFEIYADLKIAIQSYLQSGKKVR